VVCGTLRDQLGDRAARDARTDCTSICKSLAVGEAPENLPDVVAGRARRYSVGGRESWMGSLRGRGPGPGGRGRNAAGPGNGETEANRVRGWCAGGMYHRLQCSARRVGFQLSGYPVQEWRWTPGQRPRNWNMAACKSPSAEPQIWAVDLCNRGPESVTVILDSLVRVATRTDRQHPELRVHPSCRSGYAADMAHEDASCRSGPCEVQTRRKPL